MLEINASMRHIFIMQKSDLQFMTTNPAAGDPPGDDALSSKYRLWRIFPLISPGKPNTILVHGAVVPLLWPDCALHEPDKRNNEKLCGFKNLASLLHSHCGHNVWEFEYADTCDHVPSLGERCVNYGNLTNYSNELIEAIRKVQSLNLGSAVNIIAHSMGGLIARCAAQKMGNGTANKIVTLDTGHFGFELASFADDVLINRLPLDLKTPVDCAEDARPGSRFLRDLAKNFTYDEYKLFSIAASDQTVTSHTSSHLVKVSGSGAVIPPGPNTLFDIVDRNHVNIPEIDIDSLQAFISIKSFLSDSPANPKPPSYGRLYFTVVLSEKPQSGYPKLWLNSKRVGCRYNQIEEEDKEYHAVIFTVPCVKGVQPIRIEYADNKCVDSCLTEKQSSITIDPIPR
jgi:pimeloyl-ACP methyl ester carboxylesterase